MNHKLQTERQIAERFGLKIRKLQWWRTKRLTDHRYPRYYKEAGGKSVFYYLDEFEEDLAKVLEPPENMPIGLGRQKNNA